MSGLNSLYEKRQDTSVPSYGLSGLYRSDTEVPSYGLGALLKSGGSALLNIGSKVGSALGNIGTKVGSAIASGAGHVGNAISKIPVVGNVVGGAVNSLGSGVGQLVSGNIGGGLGSLYHGADKLVGGLLPNIGSAGIAPAQGWMASLYNAGDKALGGYLPNIGGGFGAASPAGGGLGSLFGGGQAAKAGAGMDTWGKLGVGANMLQAGANIYSLLNPPENTGAYQAAAGPQTQPVILGQQGAGGGGLTMQNGIPSGGFTDPTRPGVAGGGDVPTIAMSTGGKPISDIKVEKNGDKLAKAIVHDGKSRTNRVIEGDLGIDIASPTRTMEYRPGRDGPVAGQNMIQLL